MAQTRVVHCKREPYDVYIGRPGPFGNPFPLKSEADRENAIRQYRDWIATQPELMAKLSELRGKTLGCWCSPKACHGDVLAEMADATGRQG